MSITREEIRQLCIEHDRFMAEAREAERSAYMQRKHPGGDLVYKTTEDASLPASEPEPEPFYEPQAFNELQADTLAHLINELRDEWRKDHAVEIAELRGQVSALLTLLGQKMGNVPIDTKTEAEVVELLPNWRKNHVA